MIFIKILELNQPLQSSNDNVHLQRPFHCTIDEELCVSTSRVNILINVVSLCVYLDLIKPVYV